MAHQRTRIDIRDTDKVLCLKIALDRLIGHLAAIVDVIILTDKTSDLYLSGFRIVPVDTVVADMRIGRHHDLSIVGRVGKYLLISSRPCVETDLSGSCSDFSGSFAMEYSSVLKNQNCW